MVQTEYIQKDALITFGKRKFYCTVVENVVSLPLAAEVRGCLTPQLLRGQTWPTLTCTCRHCQCLLL